MSAAVYVSLLIDADNIHATRAHAHHGGVIAAVDVDAPGRVCIQATDPDALRVLAAALITAADKGDDLLAGIRLTTPTRSLPVTR